MEFTEKEIAAARKRRAESWLFGVKMRVVRVAPNPDPASSLYTVTLQQLTLEHHTVSLELGGKAAGLAEGDVIWLDGRLVAHS